MNPPVGCSLNCSKINILCYPDDYVLFAPTTQTFQVLLDSLSGTKRTLTLNISVQKSCHIADTKIERLFRMWKFTSKYWALLLNANILKLCSLHNKIYCMYQNLLIHLFKTTCYVFYLWWNLVHESAYKKKIKQYINSLP